MLFILRNTVFHVFCLSALSLLQAQVPQLSLPLGHTKNILSAAFSPDTKYIVTASEDNTAAVWEVSSGKLLHKLNEHSGKVNTAEFSTDGKLIITASRDNTAGIWDVSTGSLLHTLKDHKREVNAACFSADGKFAVTASSDKTAVIWDVQSGNMLHRLTGHTGVVSAVTVSADGRYVLTAAKDSSAAVWDRATGQLLHKLSGHTGAVRSAEYSADQRYVVTASNDSSAAIWDAVSGQLLQKLKGHSNGVSAAHFSFDARYIVTSSADSSAAIWEVASGRLVQKLQGHKGAVNGAQFSPDGKLVVSASGDHTAATWDALTGRLLHTLKGHIWEVNTARFSADGKDIVTASFDETAVIWEAETGKLLHKLEGYSRRVYAAVFSPDGKHVITALEDNTAAILDVATGKLLFRLARHSGPVHFARYSPDGSYIVTASSDRSLAIWEGAGGKLVHRLRGHTSWINDASFSADGKFIATASSDSTAAIWEAASGKRVYSLTGHTGGIFKAGFSMDGKYLVTASKDSTAAIWETGSGTLLQRLKSHRGGVQSAVFSPDGNLVVTASDDKTAAIWDVASGNLLHKLEGHSRKVNTAVFSPEGKYIVTASNDETAAIWEVSSGKLLHKLEEHIGGVLSANFSPDGKSIVTASYDKSAALWEAATGRLLHKLEGHSHWIASANFSPDGNYLVTTSEDNNIKFWKVSTGSLLYTFITVNKNDYLVIDSNGRYDGTEMARKFVYYTCQSEIVEFDQFKDLCWEPGLAGKITGVNKEPITSKKLSEINICQFTPRVEDKKDTAGGYRFDVTSQAGGLGEVLLFVNGKNVKTYRPTQLAKKENVYTLSVDESEIQDYLVSGTENKVEVKALTGDGQMQSRGAIVNASNNQKAFAVPNVFSVSVGISRYQGEKLKLSYASKDAIDFSNVITAAAKKLLNVDGKEHVVSYAFNTETGSTTLPLKENIRKSFEEIAKQATADDILVIFLAGHGVLNSANKLFYFLTQEASAFELEGVAKQVAISTEELAEWMNGIKAQKQLLILDACNSGQAVKDMQKMLTKRQVPADQQRALEKLKDRTGTYILSASASTQAAFETSLYGQGLLTYCLLFGIKYGGALNDKQFIDVIKWFNFTAEQVRELAKGIGGVQDPQIIGNASFVLGMVDPTVQDGILIPLKKKIFRRSNFVKQGIPIDDLELSSLIDRELTDIGSSVNESPFMFMPDNTYDESYSIAGTYEEKNDSIMVDIILLKGAKEVVYKFRTNEEAAKKNDLAIRIARKVKDFVAALKKDA